MNSPRIDILLSADYELFLGRNFGDADEVLFEPTRKLLNVCDDLSVPITLFADVCSVWAHRKFNVHSYADSFEKQLRGAFKNNHAVELHLHPHWLYSTHTDGQWTINTDKMYMAELGFGDASDNAPALIQRGVTYLTDLINSADYRPVAFRAAGLAMQPDERKLIEALLKHKISIDSSVAPGLKFTSDTVTVDYTNTPEKANWFMSPTGGLSIESDNGLFEIPIATFRSSLFSRIGFILRRLMSARMRRGAGLSRSAKQTRWANLKTLVSYNARYLLTNPWFSLSCDTKGYNLAMLLDGLDSFVEKHRAEPHIYFSMINHPKLMFDQQLQLLRDFVIESRRRYGGRVRFITYQQAARERNLIGDTDSSE